MLQAGKVRSVSAAFAVAVMAWQIAAPAARADGLRAASETERAVARALHLSAGDDGALKVLRAPLPAGTRVHLLSLEPAPQPGAVLARLACEDAGDCLPFYVLVYGIDGRALPLPPPSSPRAKSSTARSPVRAGDRVEIVEELSGMNLRTRGVCLQPGSIGDRIRVRTVSTKRVLRATVASQGVVKVVQ